MFGLTPYHRKNNSLARGPRDIFDMQSLFEGLFNDAVFPSLYSQGSQMKVDIKETEKEYIVDAELPGIKREEINLELHDDRLTIEVKRDETTEEESESYIRKERRTSAMSRSFWVENVKENEVTARFENGILSIVLPKSETVKVKQRKIDIQ